MTDTTSTNTTDHKPRPSASAADVVECCGGGVSLLDAEQAGRLAGHLGALAEPARLQMLSIIASSRTGEVCACDFVEPIGRSQPTISHHLKVLTEAGLVVGDKRGRWIWYRLTPGAIDNVLSTLADSISGAGSVS